LQSPFADAVNECIHVVECY